MSVIVLVMMPMVIEVGGEIGGHERGLMVVVVLVDDDRGAITEHHAPPERLGEEHGHEDLLGAAMSNTRSAREASPRW